MTDTTQQPVVGTDPTTNTNTSTTDTTVTTTVTTPTVDPVTAEVESLVQEIVAKAKEAGTDLENMATKVYDKAKEIVAADKQAIADASAKSAAIATAVAEAKKLGLDIDLFAEEVFNRVQVLLKEGKHVIKKDVKAVENFVVTEVEPFFATEEKKVTDFWSKLSTREKWECVGLGFVIVGIVGLIYYFVR